MFKQSLEKSIFLFNLFNSFFKFIQKFAIWLKVYLEMIFFFFSLRTHVHKVLYDKWLNTVQIYWEANWETECNKYRETCHARSPNTADYPVYETTIFIAMASGFTTWWWAPEGSTEGAQRVDVWPTCLCHSSSRQKEQQPVSGVHPCFQSAVRSRHPAANTAEGPDDPAYIVSYSVSVFLHLSLFVVVSLSPLLPEHQGMGEWLAPTLLRRRPLLFLLLLLLR